MRVSEEYAKTLAAILVAFSQGKTLQYRMLYTNSTSPWNDLGGGSSFLIKEDIEYRIKPEPKYRAFCNAEEFSPHRERWVAKKEGDSVRGRAVGYSDTHVGFASSDSAWCRMIDWDKAFNMLIFEDGTPFGVLCNADN